MGCNEERTVVYFSTPAGRLSLHVNELAPRAYLEGELYELWYRKNEEAIAVYEAAHILPLNFKEYQLLERLIPKLIEFKQY